MSDRAYDGVVFDIDGTLWDTAEICARAWNRALAKTDYSARFTRHDLAGIMGLRPHETREKLLGFVDDITGDKLLRACFLEEVEELEKTGAKALYPGVREVLTELSQQYSLHLVSNCDTEYLEAFLKVNDFESIFRGRRCYGMNPVTKGENLRQLIHDQNLNHPLYIGDTRGDREAAQHAGADFVWAAYGFGRSLNYFPQVHSPRELIPLLRPF